ncbi:MAG: aldo/keto reductase [Actinomycetota bacterium]
MIEQRPFGSTGHTSSRVIFGAAAMGGGPPRLFERIFETLREFGVNHIDTAASYGDSELNLAPFLADTRDEWFLASKTGDRSGADARASLERSLERLGVDHLDLIQLHNLVEEDEWHEAFSADGAVAALFRARDEGLVRHVGVTGHGLRIARMHIRSLGEAEFASVLLPYSHTLMSDPGYAADVQELIELCIEREVAVQTIKSVARRRWAPDHEGPRFAWYEPLDEGDALTRAVHYVLADDRVFLNTSSDARLLRATCEAAMSLEGRPSAEAMDADRLANGVVPIFDGGELERIR